MTSDGITTKDWNRVGVLAADIANARCADDDQAAEQRTKKILLLLEKLERKYGRLPSILATRADYTADVVGQARLLREAWTAAKRLGDHKNITLITSSLAELFVEERHDTRQGSVWVKRLAEALDVYWDSGEHGVYRRLERQIDRASGAAWPRS
jgi:hypothetical protein